MALNEPRPWRKLAIQACIAAAVVSAVAVRFVDVERDFPWGVTDSRVVYSDEGWYAANAAVAARTGTWRRDGDINPAVIMPVVPVLQYATFEMFGVGLKQARWVSATASALAFLVFCVLVRCRATRWWVPAVLFAGFHFSMIAFARLAIYEPVLSLFTVTAFMIALSVHREGKPLESVLCGVFLGLALLTKLSALILLPAVAWLLLAGAHSRGRRLRLFAAAMISMLVTFLPLRIYAAQRYAEDVLFASQVGFRDRLGFSVAHSLQGLFEALWGLFLLDPFMSPLALVVVGALVFRGKVSTFFDRLRFLPPIIVASMIWLATGGLAVILLAYGPPRYCLPLAVPVLLIATSVFASPGVLPFSSASLTRARTFALLGLLVAGGRLGVDLAFPQYTLLATVADIAELVRGEASASVRLTGSAADTVGLETGLSCMNLYVSGRLLPRQSERAPTHLVSIGPLPPTHQRGISNDLTPVLMKTYHVMDDYKGGLLLYRLEAPPSQFAASLVR